MTLCLHVNPERVYGIRDEMIYGHFIEHFHRQIYDGIYCPGHPLSDEDGFRTDVVEAMKKIRVPIMRWPGGCFVSAYHWKKAVGKDRVPMFDKAWRVEDPNTFGTDEYIKMCRKLDCTPYICTNAGTGTAEEMSDWVEYCNLKTEGCYAKQRIENGFEEPHNVKFWSIGNENYGQWEIGAKSAEEWGRLVLESAKMMRHVDPSLQLSAAAISDINWNMNLLQNCGRFLDWISLHQYWDFMAEEHNPATYEECMAFTHEIDRQVQEVRGMLTALKLEKKIRIAFDEWNLRSWHHPHVHLEPFGITPEDYVKPRDKNDDNSTYTMADAVFTACFLNAMNRNCDIVGMANFAPILNTRGCIYSHDGGIVLRSTYHVFDLFVNHMGDKVIDLWPEGDMPTLTVPFKGGKGEVTTDALDLLATAFTDKDGIAICAVNKDPDKAHTITLPAGACATQLLLNGPSKDAYNDVDRNECVITEQALEAKDGLLTVTLPAHSVSVIKIG